MHTITVDITGKIVKNLQIWGTRTEELVKQPDDRGPQLREPHGLQPHIRRSDEHPDHWKALTESEQSITLGKQLDEKLCKTSFIGVLAEGIDQHIGQIGENYDIDLKSKTCIIDTLKSNDLH